MAKWKVAGINFDHQHMGDLLRQVHEHPDAEIVGISDEQPGRMSDAKQAYDIPDNRVFIDFGECLETAQPDLVVLCPATAKHGEWTKKVAPYGVHVLMEKPFAASLAEADEMVEAVKKAGKRLAINWPLAWYPPHVTSKRLIDEGAIGDVIEVHYYDGNRGPVRHKADKVEVTGNELQKAKSESWFYKREHGGGSLLDYLGYGTTLGTWYYGGKAPIEVTCMVDAPAGLEVDEHSVTVVRYDAGLSKFETRWGTFTDPWTHQPQPKCGFVIVGTKGTISSYDFEPTVRVQTGDHPEGKQVPVDELQPPHQDPIQYFIDCIANDKPVEGPLCPEICRIGQQIVDTACQSAEKKTTLPLIQ